MCSSNVAVITGADQWLVQRTIRSPGHCDFTIAEQVEAFEATVNWELLGIRPAGDEVLNLEAMASQYYGCTFTRNTTGADDLIEPGVLRRVLPSCL